MWQADNSLPKAWKAEARGMQNQPVEQPQKMALKKKKKPMRNGTETKIGQSRG